MKICLAALGLMTALSLQASTVVTNPSFETPSEAGGFAYNASGATWTFLGQAGIASNGSSFAFLAAPDGVQEAFLQVYAAAAAGSFSETVTNVAVGDVINFFEAQRPGYAPSSFNVLYNGSVLGSFTPGSTTWLRASVTIPTGAASSGTLTFQATGAAGSDLDAGIDDITVSSAATPEPGTILMGALGVALLLARDRARRSA